MDPDNNKAANGGGVGTTEDEDTADLPAYWKRPKVAVGSQNPVKVVSCRQAFMECFPRNDFEFIGYDVDSGVGAQPFTDEETRKGAETRAKNAAAKHAEDEAQDPEYAIGLEGGVMWKNTGPRDESTLVCFAWMAVYHPATGKMGYGRTAEFTLPQKVAKLVNEGKELGEADDEVFGRTDSKKKNGAVGLLSNGIIDRTVYYRHALILACIPFMNPELYPVQES